MQHHTVNPGGGQAQLRYLCLQMGKEGAKTYNLNNTVSYALFIR
jgi:hypothetical protein